VAERWPAIIGLLLAAAVAALSLAAPATAKLTFRKSISAEIAAKSDGSTRAKCRGGARHLISGGFDSDSPLSGEQASTVAAFASAPAGARGWRMRAANFDGAPETVTASALCSKRNPEVRIRSRRASIPAAGEAKLTATCRRGEEAIAGGFAAPGSAQDGGPEVIAVESRRKGRRKWRVIAYNNSPGVDGKVEAFARCASRRPGLRTVKEKGVAVDQAPLELRPRCEKGQELWSGGFVARFESFDPFATVLADRSYADGRRWVSRFVGYQAGGTVKALAYCRERA
jgi:hypothetical protein